MWIKRDIYDTLNAERIKAMEEARVLFDQNATLRSTMTWALRRVEHVELEKAMLLKQYMGIAVKVPSYVVPEPTNDDVLGGANMWNDVGDDEAKRRGIDWADDGTLKQ